MEYSSLNIKGWFVDKRDQKPGFQPYAHMINLMC
jgi:hypothetical protein